MFSGWNAFLAAEPSCLLIIYSEDSSFFSPLYGCPVILLSPWAHCASGIVCWWAENTPCQWCCVLMDRKHTMPVVLCVNGQKTHHASGAVCWWAENTPCQWCCVIRGRPTEVCISSLFSATAKNSPMFSSIFFTFSFGFAFFSFLGGRRRTIYTTLRSQEIYQQVA